MVESQSDKRKPLPVALISMLTLLIILTGGLGAAIGYGFYTGVLVPYWQNMSDAHAAIFAQLIFFLAAAWASVLVPLLFREQLRSIEDASRQATEACANIKTLLEKAASDSKEQFESITRLQLMSVGYLVDPRQLEQLQKPEERKQYVNSAWDAAKRKIDTAIKGINGNKKNSIQAIQYRSSPWWDKVRSYQVLKSFHDDFRVISDKKNKQYLDLADLQAVNEATRRIQDFDPAPQEQETVPTMVRAPLMPPPSNGGAPDSPQLPQ